MADYGREEQLAKVARYFNGTRDAGPVGCQDGPSQPPAAADRHPLDPDNYYGLAYLYARSAPDVWPAPVTQAPFPTGATAAAGAFGREPGYDRSEAHSPQSASVGAWEGLRDPGPVPHSNPSSDVGSSLEMGWDGVGSIIVGVLGSLGVMTMLGFLKRHKLAATLWGLALIAWVLPVPH